ncbi:MAG: hypothetical protein KGI38_13075, partial [Thaumarchaeota archaeon]|nr:hypothetical protein [Nitrososphaerota archaeon]
MSQKVHPKPKTRTEFGYVSDMVHRAASTVAAEIAQNELCSTIRVCFEPVSEKSLSFSPERCSVV